MAETKVIINMTESEYTELNDNNSVKSMKTTGVLKVINPSAEHRLWNLRMSLANIDFTNLKKENAKESLEPGKEWLFDYEVPNIKEPILKLVETFDTSKSAEGINFNYTLGNADETTIKLSLQNTSSKKIKNIVAIITTVAVKECVSICKLDNIFRSIIVRPSPFKTTLTNLPRWVRSESGRDKSNKENAVKVANVMSRAYIIVFILSRFSYIIKPTIKTIGVKESTPPTSEPK